MSLLLSWGRHARLTVVVANKIVPIPSWNLGRNSEFLTYPLYASARMYGLLSSRASSGGLRGCARWGFAVGMSWSMRSWRPFSGPWHQVINTDVTIGNKRMATIAAVITYSWHTIVTSFYVTFLLQFLFSFLFEPNSNNRRQRIFSSRRLRERVTAQCSFLCQEGSSLV